MKLVRAMARPLYHRLGLAELRRRWRTRPRRFRRELSAHLEERRLRFLEQSDTPHLRALARDGFVLLSSSHSPEATKALRAPLLELMERIRRGERDPGWDVVAYPKDGIYRIRRVQEVLPAARALLEHARVIDLVRAYLGSSWRYTVYVDYKPELVHDDTTVPHVDTWRRQLKAFTPLEDVNPDNAPFVYWAGSHRDGLWQRRFDYLLWAGDYIGSGGVVPPHVLRDRVDRGELRGVEVTANTGTVIVADTRGAHRASNLRAGFRLQLVEVFDPN